MEPFLFYLAAVTLGLGMLLGFDLWSGTRGIPFLSSVEPSPDFSGPTLSVIVAARNEAKKIRPALLSLLQQDYPVLEVVVVNDRSADGTGQILEEMSLKHPRLQTLTVDHLPKGWLGKNHALYLGSRKASGELLLFTDADVVMHPSTLSRAVHYLQDRGRDHLTLGADFILSGIWLKMFVAAFGLFFFSFLRPWKAKDPSSRSYVGIGAFNLVRREVYRKIGTHQAICMRPDDDLKLGKLIKRNGHSQEFLFGTGLLAVQWYSSMGELIDGLMKNMFAGVDYRISTVLQISPATASALCLALHGMLPHRGLDPTPQPGPGLPDGPVLRGRGPFHQLTCLGGSGVSRDGAALDLYPVEGNAAHSLQTRDYLAGHLLLAGGAQGQQGIGRSGIVNLDHFGA